MKTARGRWAAAGSLLAVAILSGCGGHSKPTAISQISATSASPSASSAAPAASSPVSAPASAAPLSSASPSSVAASTSPSASADPSEGAQKAAAVKVVQDFFAGINHQTDTGEQGPVIATFTTKCRFCQREVFGIADALTNGQQLQGGHIRLLHIDDVGKSAPNIMTVIVTSNEEAARVLSAKGAILQSYDATPNVQHAFQLQLAGDKALIFQVDVVSHG